MGWPRALLRALSPQADRSLDLWQAKKALDASGPLWPPREAKKPQSFWGPSKRVRGAQARRRRQGRARRERGRLQLLWQSRPRPST